MTAQTAIDVPTATARPRPIVIPPNAPRCWIVDEPGFDDYGYPDAPHFATHADALALAAYMPDAKVVQVPFVCATATCTGCKAELELNELGCAPNHFPDWAEAERVARCDNWKIGPRGEFNCPDCATAPPRSSP